MSVTKRKNDLKFSAEDFLLNSEFKSGFHLNYHTLKSSLDDYLLTENWPRYDWNQIYDSFAKPAYRHENTFFISGQLTNQNNKPIANEPVAVILPNLLMPFESISDSSGHLRIPVFGYSGDEHIIIQPLKNDTLYNKLHFKKDILTQANPDNFPKHKHSGSLEQDVREQAENSLINNSYNLHHDVRGSSGEKTVDENKLLEFKQMYTELVILKDYISFSTMIEVFREIVTGVFVQAGKDEIKINADDPGLVFKDTPLLLIDGVPTYNPKAVLALDPKDVLSIGGIANPRNLFNFSTAGQNGVLVINTTLDPSLHNFRDSNISLYEGLNIPKSHAYQEHYLKEPQTSAPFCIGIP